MTTLTFTHDVQDRAWSALTEYASRFDEVVPTLMFIFFGERVAALPDERRREITADEQLWAYFSAWFILEVEFGGLNVTDDFIEKFGRFRSRAEIAYLRAMRRSRVRLYEVQAVTTDVGLRVRDCVSGEAIEVRERLFTHEAVEGMVVPLRLRADADGATVIDGTVLGGFDHRDKEMILAKLAASGEELDPTVAIAQCWVEKYFLAAPPILYTTTGEPTMLCSARYAILDEASLHAALRPVRSMHRDDERTYTWVRGRGRVVHATLRIDGSQLVVETFSEKRHAATRQLLESRCGEAVLRFCGADTEEPMEALKRHRAEPANEKPRAPDVEALSLLEALVLNELEERYYRAWIDTPLPALLDKTPRQAAGMRSLRGILVNLIKDFSVDSKRREKRGEAACDFASMWRELRINPENPHDMRKRIVKAKTVGVGGAIYQLKIVLSRSKPAIWRRLLVDAAEPLDRVHMILNAAMGWLDGHLHGFEVNGVHYGVRHPNEGWSTGHDERKFRLRDLSLPADGSFGYNYDFGDG